jgi:hypothetical protein
LERILVNASEDVVALVIVAFLAVKFWRVDDPESKRFISVACPLEKLVANRFVEEAVVAKNEVVVAFDEVEFNKVRFWKVEEPFTRRLPKVEKAAKRLVLEAVVLKRLVVVALVVVEFRPVKFKSVVDPVSKRFESVVRPAATFNVPLKLAAEEIFCPLINPEVMTPRFEFVE